MQGLSSLKSLPPAQVCVACVAGAGSCHCWQMLGLHAVSLLAPNRVPAGLPTSPAPTVLPTQPRSYTAGGRLLFAATEEGCVRSYKLPLTAEHQAARCGRAPVTRLAVTRDESTLFAATADGCLFVFDIKDRDAARLATWVPAALLLCKCSL